MKKIDAQLKLNLELQKDLNLKTSKSASGFRRDERRLHALGNGHARSVLQKLMKYIPKPVKTDIMAAFQPKLSWHGSL